MASGRLLSLLLFLALASRVLAANDKKLITFYDKAEFAKRSAEDSAKAAFFLARFAQADFEPKCHKDTKPLIVPVYFHAGGTLELPCKMCEFAFVVNGLPKAWKHIPLHHALDFLADPDEFLNKYLEKDERYVQSLTKSLKPEGGGFHRRAHLMKRMYRDGANGAVPSSNPFADDIPNPVPPPQKIASIHNFIQSDGKLYIHGTMLESSGIYFCYDEHSRAAHTRIFFMAVAMAPLVYHSYATGRPDQASLWNVDDWLSSGMPSEPMCTANEPPLTPMPDEYAHMRYTPAPLPEANLREMPLDLTFTTGSLTVATNLQIDREYGEWTLCEEGFKYREVHCVLKRNGKIPEKFDESFVDWAPKLNALFDKIPTLRLHSYFLPSLLYKGGSYGSGIESGEYCDSRKTRIWDVYKQVIIPAASGKKDLEDFESALNSDHVSPTFDNSFCYDWNADWTLGKDDKWWSVRGISYIQKQACAEP